MEKCFRITIVEYGYGETKDEAFMDAIENLSKCPSDQNITDTSEVCPACHQIIVSCICVPVED